MEKSIETIWKEGFLDEKALIVPKINSIYNQKSIDIVDKFRRMYKINIIGLVIFAAIILPVSIGVEIPYMGIPMFFLFLFIAFFAQKFKNKLDKIGNINKINIVKIFIIKMIILLLKLI